MAPSRAHRCKAICPHPGSFSAGEAQNRTTEAGEELCDHQGSTQHHHHSHHYTMSSGAICTHFFNISRAGSSTTFLFQCQTTLSVEKFFLIPGLNLSWHNFPF